MVYVVCVSCIICGICLYGILGIVYMWNMHVLWYLFYYGIYMCVAWYWECCLYGYMCRASVCCLLCICIVSVCLHRSAGLQRLGRLLQPSLSSSFTPHTQDDSLETPCTQPRTWWLSNSNVYMTRGPREARGSSVLAGLWGQGSEPAGRCTMEPGLDTTGILKRWDLVHFRGEDVPSSPEQPVAREQHPGIKPVPRL